MSRQTPEALARVRVELDLHELLSLKNIGRRSGLSRSTLWRLRDTAREERKRNDLVHTLSRYLGSLESKMADAPTELDMTLAAQLAQSAAEDGRTPQEQLAYLLSLGLRHRQPPVDDSQLSKDLDDLVSGAVARLLDAQREMSDIVSRVCGSATQE